MITGEDEISITTAKIKNAHMTTAMTEDGRPIDEVKSYNINTKDIFATAELKNAPYNTKVVFKWYYVDGDILIAEFPLDSGNEHNDMIIYSTISLDEPWPIGIYKVEIYVEDRTEPDQIIEFQMVQ